MIELPKNVDLVKFAQKVYELSSPQGFGFLHAVSGGLSEEDAKSCIRDEDRYTVLDMDYVHGRACKMFVTKSDGKWLLPDRWYDHTDEQYKELLQTFGIELPSDAEHGCACNCVDCQRKR